MKNIYFRMLCIMLSLMGTALVATGCIDIPSSTSSNVTSSSSGLLGGATMALSLDNTTLKPLKTTDVFKRDTPVIHCSVLLLNAPEETIVSAEWIFIKGETGKENVKINSKAINTDGPRYLAFSLVRPGEAWPRGDYKVVISVNGKQELTVPFRIE